MVFVVADPIKQNLETATSEVDVLEHFVGDVRVKEGIIEDIGILPLPGEHNFVNLSEFGEDTMHILVVQLGLLHHAARMGHCVSAVDLQGQSDDGQTVSITESLRSQLVLQVSYKHLVLKESLHPRLVFFLVEIADFLVVVNLGWGEGYDGEDGGEQSLDGGAVEVLRGAGGVQDVLVHA